MRKKFHLPYLPPYDYEGLLQSYKCHQIGQLEKIENGRFTRIITFNHQVGQVVISNDGSNSRLKVLIDFPDEAYVESILGNVRAMFDLDVDPSILAQHFKMYPKISSLLKKHPGVRLPSGWDAFEVSVATILGQLVSMANARALVQGLIDLLGEDSGMLHEGRPIKLFPSAKKIAESDLTLLKTTRIRKETLRIFSQAIVDKVITLEPTEDVGNFISKMIPLKGIGPWTAQYIALKALRNTDAFPATDLVIARVLKDYSPVAIEKLSPWRGYVASLWWKEYSFSKIKDSSLGG